MKKFSELVWRWKMGNSYYKPAWNRNLKGNFPAEKSSMIDLDSLLSIVTALWDLLEDLFVHFFTNHTTQGCVPQSLKEFFIINPKDSIVCPMIKTSEYQLFSWSNLCNFCCNAQCTWPFACTLGQMFAFLHFLFLTKGRGASVKKVKASLHFQRIQYLAAASLLSFSNQSNASGIFGSP